MSTRKGHRKCVLALERLSALGLDASSSEDCTIRLWDARAGGVAVRALVLPAPAAALASAGPACCLFAACGRSIFEFDLRADVSTALVRRAEPVRTAADCAREDINSLDLSASRLLLAADDSGALCVVAVDAAQQGLPVLHTVQTHTSVASAAKFRPGSASVMVSGGLDCMVAVTSVPQSGAPVVRANRVLDARQNMYNPPHVHTLCTTRQSVVAGVGDGSLALFSYAASGLQPRRVVQVHDACVCHQALLPGGNGLTVVSIANDSSMHVTDMDRGVVRKRFGLPAKPNVVLAVPDAAVLVGDVLGGIHRFYI
jgi:WD40 repeat protein